MKWSFKKFASNMVTLAGVLAIAWVVVSYVDVIVNHSEAAEWNAIKIMVERGEIDG